MDSKNPDETKQGFESLKKKLAEYQEANARLRQSELNYRNLVENIAEATMVAQDRFCIHANARAEDLFGYSKEELASKPLSDFIHNEDKDRILAGHAESPKDGNLPELAPLRIVHKAGISIWVALKRSWIYWNGLPAVLCLMTDITKQKQAEKKYQHVLESRFEGFMLLDENRVISDVNKALLRMSGYASDDFIGHPAENFFDKTSVDFYSASPDHMSFEALFRAQDGRELPVLFNRSTLRDHTDQITGYIYFLTDLTELKTTQEELKKAEQQYRNMYHNAVQGMLQSRLSGEFIRVNPAFSRILGYDSVDEILSLKEGAKALYVSLEDRDRMIQELQKNGSITNHELQLKRKDGKLVWISANFRYVETDGGDAIIEGILVDNTEKKLLEEELRRDRIKFRDLSIHDNLTGLYNTRYLYQRLNKLIEASTHAQKPFSLVFMDMDNFKHVVDTYGHLKGSQALKEVAHTIKKCINKPCFGVAYGGDEFVVVLPDVDKTEARKQVEQIREKMKQTAYLTQTGHNVRLAASFGVATFPDDAGTREDLLALADQAMFHVKQTGKGDIGTIVDPTGATSHDT